MAAEFMHGWYSEKMADLTGTRIYRTTDGEDVEVTSVSETRDNHGLKLKDLQYVGKVVECVGEGRKGTRHAKD